MIFLVDYRHDDKTYSVDVHAENWKEAEQHLRSLKMNGEVIGSLEKRIPVALTIPKWLRNPEILFYALVALILFKLSGGM